MCRDCIYFRTCISLVSTRPHSSAGFSFGNVVIYTLTHEWPQPQAPNKYEGGQLIALSELVAQSKLQRREHCIKSFTVQERMLFLPIVEHCLAYLPDERHSSVKLMHELKQIESSLLKDDNTVAPFEQLRQQLSAKEEECRQKDEMIRNKDAELQRLQNEKEKGDRTTPGLEKQLVKEAETGLKPPVQPKPKLTLSTESLTVPPKTEAATVKKRTPPPVSPKPRHASFSGLPSPAGVCVSTCVVCVCVCVCVRVCVCVCVRVRVHEYVCQFLEIQ